MKTKDYMAMDHNQLLEAKKQLEARIGIWEDFIDESKNTIRVNIFYNEENLIEKNTTTMYQEYMSLAENKADLAIVELLLEK